jgi:type IV pilus assembly protein PilE
MSGQPQEPVNRMLRLAVWLVVLIVLATAVLVSRPLYRQYVIEVTRADATRELAGLAQRLQRCFARTGNYALLDSVQNTCVTLPQATPGGMYLITGDVAENTFRLTATPQQAQAKDMQCGAFTLNQAGGQEVTGTAKQEECWAVPRN